MPQEVHATLRGPTTTPAELTATTTQMGFCRDILFLYGLLSFREAFF